MFAFFKGANRSSKKFKKQKMATIKDYEKLGRSFETILEAGFVNQARIYRINFIRGIFFGLGTFLGGTVLVGFLIWLLSSITDFGILDGVVEAILQVIERRQSS